MFARIQALFVFSKRPVSDDSSRSLTDRPLPPPGTIANTSFLRFSIKEQVLFAKRLSFLVKAGVSLVEGLTLIRNQTKSKRKQKVYDTITADVNAGQFLSHAMQPYRHLFGDYSINIIRVGEQAGVLSENLIYLADELAKRQTLQRKVRGALVYPIFITIATFGVTGLLTVYIFPKIMPIFSSLNIALPLSTRILLAVSTYLQHWGIHTIIGVIAFFVLFAVVRKTVHPVQVATDWFLLRLPLVGTMMRAYNAANFCRTLGLTVYAGVHLTEAVYITADVTKNTIYKNAYRKLAEGVMRGERISSNLAQYKSIFPDILPHMILVGETTGSLSSTLGYLSELYETELDEQTKNLSNSLEPILLMTMGVLVGIIAISVITPIYEVTKSIDKMK